MIEKIFPLRRIRSFVRRDSRITAAQQHAIDTLLPRFGLSLQDRLLDLAATFQREAKTNVEIGFGSGHSLLEVAKRYPEQNFIGIETHLPGIGALLLGVAEAQLTNVRVYYGDAVEVFQSAIPENSLDVVQIFFPDPWPKRKHHKRRLIQETFINTILPKLKRGAALHLATDWQHYAAHMMAVLSRIPELKNSAGVGQYADRSTQRPIITKFEQRGQESGRQIWELQFVRALPNK